MASFGSNGDKSSGAWRATLLTAALMLVAASTASTASDGIDIGVDPVDDHNLDIPLTRADGMRFVPDVRQQFKDLTERPDALGMHIRTTPDPSECRHYQAITRVDAADGTPYFLVTRNGNTPEIPWLPNELACNDSPSEKYNGNLIVFKMGSRNKDGERLRSNRFEGNRHLDGTLPRQEDEAVIFFTVTEYGLVHRNGDTPDTDPGYPSTELEPKGGGRPQRVYRHPGGMQLVGHVMAMAMDTPYKGNSVPFNIDNGYEQASTPSQIMFLDVSDPEDPKVISRFAPKNPNGVHLGAADGVGITPLANGRYLMAIHSGFEHKPIYFYRSTLANSETTPNVLESPDLSWEYIGLVEGPRNIEHAHQSFQFLRQGDINGNLYMVGARGYAHPAYGDQDRIDLYKLTDEKSPAFEPGGTLALEVEFNGTRMSPYASTGSVVLADLAAASGFHVSPSGELLFYATLHDTDGPGGTVSLAEWRHINMVRDGSPTYFPTTQVQGSYSVDEGSSVSLTGSAKAPITKAWIELFHALYMAAPYIGEDSHYNSYYPVVDWDDRNLDDFDDLNLYEKQSLTFEGDFWHADKAQSLKWFAPAGCTIQLRDYVAANPNNHVQNLNLYGEGPPSKDVFDLRTVKGVDPVTGSPSTIADMNQKIDAVHFGDDCTKYYTEGFVMAWDLDVNGSYETVGDSVAFKAIEGPANRSIPARGQPKSGGTSSKTTTVEVAVRNVAPRIESALLLDQAGNEHLGDVSAGAPITLDATFTDPGELDTQTASVNWGDGSAVETAFDSFSDARSGALGRLIHKHKFPAGTFTLTLTVKDDDGGAVTTTRTVVAKSADLALTMKAPADLAVQIGGEAKLSYAITLKNIGPGVATGVAVTDNLPSGTQFVSASISGGVCLGPPVGSGGTVTCSIQAMPSATSAAMTLVIKVKRTLLGGAKVVNKATVSSGSTDPKLANNAASAETKFVGALLN